MVQDLAKNVDKALNAAKKTLPPPIKDFITTKQRKNFDMRLDEIVTDERASVAEF